MTILLIFAASTIICFIIRHLLKVSEDKTNIQTIQASFTLDTEIIPLPLTAQQFAEKYKNGNGKIKGGTVCFWGHWFGKPYDNFHQIKFVEFDTYKSILTIGFSMEERLTVFNPSLIEEIGDGLQINRADKIHWEWYYYGKTFEKENLSYYYIINNNNKLEEFSNSNLGKVDWSDLTLMKPAILLT